MESLSTSHPICVTASNYFFGVMAPSISPPKLYLNRVSPETEIMSNELWTTLWEDYYEPFARELYKRYFTSGLPAWRLTRVKVRGREVMVPQIVDTASGTVFCVVKERRSEARDFYFRRREPTFRGRTWNDQLNIAYDPNVDFFPATSFSLDSGDNIMDWITYVDSLSINASDTLPPPPLKFPYNTGWGANLHEYFDMLQRKSIFQRRNALCAKIDFMMLDNLPQTDEGARNFHRFHSKDDQGDQSFMMNPNVRDFYTLRNRAPQSSIPPNTQHVDPTTTQNDTYSHPNPQQAPGILPMLEGEQGVTTSQLREDVRASNRKTLTEPFSHGDFRYTPVGTAVKPERVDKQDPESTLPEVDRSDSMVARIYGVFLKSDGGARVTAQALQLEIEMKKQQIQAVRTYIEKSLSTCLQLVYGESLNELLIDAITEVANETDTDPKIFVEEEGFGLDSQRILFRFQPRWAISEDMLAIANESELFDYETMRMIYAAALNLDSELYSKPTSSTKKNKKNKKTKKPKNNKELLSEEEEKEEGEKKTEKKKKRKNEDEDETSRKKRKSDEKETESSSDEEEKGKKKKKQKKSNEKKKEDESSSSDEEEKSKKSKKRKNEDDETSRKKTKK